jgi:hypothetical protein
MVYLRQVLASPQELQIGLEIDANSHNKLIIKNRD